MSESIPVSSYAFRPLNYLGSKYRLLDFIKSNVAHLTPPTYGVCDLFSGSGCVSYKLSESYPVVSCDIQNYSKVISNALLNEFQVSRIELESLRKYVDSDKHVRLISIFKPLIDLEESAIARKSLEKLAAIVENGSVLAYSIDLVETPLNNEIERVLENLAHRDIASVDVMVARYYGGVYFSYRQAVALDAILGGIHRCIDDRNKDLFIAALLSTASELASTVGKHFAQPLKARNSAGEVKPTVYNKAVKDKTINAVALFWKWLERYMCLPKSGLRHSVMQGDWVKCLETLPESVKTVYADPPYTRDHYSRFYHVLETIALRDEPELSTVKINGQLHLSNGLYRKSRHQSPFCIRSKAPEVFLNMFRIVSERGMNLLLSYSPYDETKKSHPRVVTIDQLKETARNFFNAVRIVSAGNFQHSKLTSTDHFLEASEEAEILFLCKNDK